MKVISGGKVWVQKYNISDLINVFEDFDDLPNDTIISKLYEYGEAFVASQESMYDFEEIEDEETVQFLKDVDFILDYEDLKGKSEEQLLLMEQEIQSGTIEKATEIKSSKRRQLFCHSTYSKVLDIQTYMMYLKGEIKYSIPLEETQDEEQNPQSPQGKGLKRTIKSMFTNKQE